MSTLISGKTVAVVLFAALLILVVNVLRQLRCSWPLAIALTGLLPATQSGLLVGSTVGGDVLSVVLQVAALLVVYRGPAAQHGPMDDRRGGTGRTRRLQQADGRMGGTRGA